MKLFALGVYVTGAIFTFIVVGFLCVLGGNSADLWKPFVYAAFWPIMPLFFARTR
jgi:hypothetical protein